MNLWSNLKINHGHGFLNLKNDRQCLSDPDQDAVEQAMYIVLELKTLFSTAQKTFWQPRAKYAKEESKFYFTEQLNMFLYKSSIHQLPPHQ